VRRILAELPETLDETYERILREIPKTNQVHAHRLLQCLTVAVYPLEVEELAEVLAINFDAEGGIPKLNEGFRWSDQEQAVLSACSSLVTIVENRNSRRVQFSHFSVKEFLTSDRLAASVVDVLHRHHIRLEHAHTIMAQACLSVLLRLDHYMDQETIKSYPLARYASDCLVDHAKFGDVLSHINNGLDDLLDPDKPHFDAWLWLQYGDWNRRTFVWSSSFEYPGESFPDQSNSEHLVLMYPPRIFPLYHALALRHTWLVQHLISKRPHDLDAGDIYGTTALHISAYFPICKVVRMLIERTAAINVNVRDSKGRTPLHYAMHEDGRYWYDDKQEPHDDVFHCARLLLDSGASAEAQNNDGSTPLHVAVSKIQTDEEVIRLLIENSTKIDLRNNKGQTALHEASLRGQPNIIQLILNNGADVDASDNSGSTPLHLAISGASQPVAPARVLLKHGASVRVRDEKGQTALHRASQRGLSEVVQLILDHDADVHALDGDGSSPLHLTIYEGIPASTGLGMYEVILKASLEAIQLLLKHGVNINLQNHMGQTALHKASKRGHLDTVRLLLDHGADSNLQDNHGSTPLHLATCHGDQQVVQLILDHDADVDAQDNDGSTPLHLAISEADIWPNPEIVQLLLKHGPNINVQNRKGQTALHQASQRAHLETFQLILNSGPDVDVLDHDGLTPLHVAISEEHVEVVVRLLKHGASVHTQNNRGETIFQAASARGFTELLSIFAQPEQIT
jgi:ankyrin repeat protein